jgi:hypothetical protein
LSKLADGYERGVAAWRIAAEGCAGKSVRGSGWGWAMLWVFFESVPRWTLPHTDALSRVCVGGGRQEDYDGKSAVQVERLRDGCPSRRDAALHLTWRGQTVSRRGLLAQDGTPNCISHGGGRRCLHEGCSKAAARGGPEFCKAHGGGRRCLHEGCYKSAQGGTRHCKAHGGGRRCVHEACPKSAEGSTHFCIAHGGGRRCQHDGCSKSARGGAKRTYRSLYSWLRWLVD